ncbi:MAG: right-handed parallel beta-helix repeat-containing protein [Acidobacteriota bacterium]
MIKSCASGLKLLAPILCFVVLPAAAYGASAAVDCSGATPGAFTSITAALATLPNAGPNSISVKGTCSESVSIINRTDLIIFGNPTATVQFGNPNARLLRILDSQRISVTGITFDGSFGIVVNEHSRADFDSITVQNSGNVGLAINDSHVHISNSTVANNARAGININGGTLDVDSGVTVSGNARSGIAVTTARLRLNGGDGTPGTENVIRNNTGSGVSVANGAVADINGDNRITNNGGLYGLLVIHTSNLIMSDGIINNNTGIGVRCGETSHCEWSGATQINSNGGGGIEITDHSDAYIDGGIDISGNTGTGILVDLSSLLNSLGSNTIKNNTVHGIEVNNLSVFKFEAIDTITGNTDKSLVCDNESLVVGDISKLTKVSCSRNHLSKKTK